MQHTDEQRVLTPLQFRIARALARDYRHLWSSVPDGTYDVDAIRAYSNTIDPRIGIGAPSLCERYGFLTVVHSTNSGRLCWEVGPVGNVHLEVRRPAALLHLPPPCDEENTATQSILVANVEILNEASDDLGYEFGEVIFGTSDYRLSHDEDGQVKAPWNYYERGFIGSGGVETDFLYERHVAALVRPLVTLLSLNASEADPPPVLSKDSVVASWPPLLFEEERETAWEDAQQTYMDEYNAWRARVIGPACARAKEILAPLFALALPDPIDLTGDDDDERLEAIGEDAAWTRFRSFGPYCQDRWEYDVWWKGQSYAVESEKTATYMVLALFQHPDRPVFEVMQEAIKSDTYRPPTV